MAVALGAEASGVFTNSDQLWEDLELAGMYTGDRVWRFPLWKGYGKELKEQQSVDITNIGKGSQGGACSAAAFLRVKFNKSVFFRFNVTIIVSKCLFVIKFKL